MMETGCCQEQDTRNVRKHTLELYSHSTHSTQYKCELVPFLNFAIDTLMNAQYLEEVASYKCVLHRAGARLCSVDWSM